jgi:hypothetical protein
MLRSGVYACAYREQKKVVGVFVQNFGKLTKLLLFVPDSFVTLAFT